VSRRSLRLLAIFAAFVVLSAGDCEIGDLGDILNEPGRIVVTNTGTEPAIVAIIADDVKSYPTLAAGGTSAVKTNTGGRFQVRVMMTPEQLIEYRAKLTSMRRDVEGQIAGTNDPLAKTRLFTDLAGLKAALVAADSGTGASCAGNLTLNADQATEVGVGVRWVPTDGGGFWELSCGSN
jgi:hypothetical protein